MAKKKEASKYFFFPIQLLQGFLVDTDTCLYIIYCYCIYKHSIQYPNKSNFEWTGNEDVIESMRVAGKFFSESHFNDRKKVYDVGKEQYELAPKKSPMTSLNVNIFWDFFENPKKTDFEKVCLLGFLAIKSILQTKKYCKITKKYWMSRMDGRAKAVNDLNELSPELLRYTNDYQNRRIKNELIDNWGLIHYSYHMRGFYVSFKLSLEKLSEIAINSSPSTKAAKRKIEAKLAREKALNKLNRQLEISEMEINALKKKEIEAKHELNNQINKHLWIQKN